MPIRFNSDDIRRSPSADTTDVVGIGFVHVIGGSIAKGKVKRIFLRSVSLLYLFDVQNKPTRSDAHGIAPDAYLLSRQIL